MNCLTGGIDSPFAARIERGKIGLKGCRVAIVHSPGEVDPQLLAGVRLFEGLTSAALAVIAREARRHQVVRGEFLFHADDPATAVYVLTQGRAKLMQITPEGHQVTLLMVPPGALLGGLAALEDTVYGVWAQAVDDCQALSWSGKTMARLLETYPRLAMNILRLIGHRMQDLYARYTELCTERVEQRVARTLVRLASQCGQALDGSVLVTLPVSHQDLAEMVGTTQYSVSRILGRWQEQGLVEAHRRQVVISRPHGLVAIAENFPPDLTSADSW